MRSRAFIPWAGAFIISERISSGDLVVLKKNSWGLSKSQCLILGRRRSVLPPPAIGLVITNIFIPQRLLE
jgi:hypothetical protein